MDTLTIGSMQFTAVVQMALLTFKLMVPFLIFATAGWLLLQL